MDENLKRAIFKQIAAEPFAQKFAMELTALDSGYAKVEMVVTSDMINVLGLIHGGALFALIDGAFEAASNSHGTVAVALNMNVTFVMAPAVGSRLSAEAHEFSRTRKTASYDIQVHDDKDHLIARCQALVYRKGTPLPFLEDIEKP